MIQDEPWMLSSISDITARKQAEEHIRQQHAFLKTVIDALPHPFYVIDATDYTIKLANTAAAMDGRAEDATCYALTHHRPTPCNKSGDACPLVEVKKTKKPLSCEHLHSSADGKLQQHYEIHGCPIFDDHDNVVQMIEYTIDITDRKQAEEALKKYAHTLNERVNELNCLYAMSELVRRNDIVQGAILQESVHLLAQAYQFPDITAVCITWGDDDYRTANFRHTPWSHHRAILVHGEQAGTLEVCYLEERPEEDEGPFLAEERKLLNAVVDLLGRSTATANAKRNTERWLRAPQTLFI